MFNFNTNEKVRVFASKDNWIESNAVAQLRGVSELPGMRMAVGMPDLHPGKGGPIGAAFVSDGIVYPHLIGNDVGCGMGLWLSDLSRRKLKLDRWTNKLVNLESPWEGDRTQWMLQHRFDANCHDESVRAMGTIGGGNHFAELQCIESVEDELSFKTLGLDADALMVLVHSGSRGVGQALLRAHMAKHGYAGLNESSADAHEYLAAHNDAVRWATLNRALIAFRFLSALGSGNKFILDAPHNFVEKALLGGTPCLLHRKGATPANQGALVIPGSRGSMSYLVLPRGEQEANAQTLAHGAGRKWARSDCRARLAARYDEASLQRTELGNRVICEDRDLLYQEAPQAYKNIERVIQDLLDAGLIAVVAKMRPLITYKTRRVE